MSGHALSRPPVLAALAALCLLAAAAPAFALTLVVDHSFGTSTLGLEPEGLAFGVEDVMGTPTEVLYVTEGNSCNPCTVHVYRADAADDPNGLQPSPIRSFSIPLAEVRGLDVMGGTNGNLLASSNLGFNDRVVEVSRVDGSLIPNGIDINVNPLSVNPFMVRQPESVILHNGVGTSHRGVESIFLGEEETPAELLDILDVRFGGTPNVTNRIDVEALHANFLDPSGMDFDPATGILLVADDSSGGGVAHIYAVAAGGGLVGQVNVGLLTLGHADCLPTFGCSDPEGVAFDDVLGQRLFVAFEGDQRVITFQISNIPEPGSAALLGVGLVALGWLRRRE
jgi:hypothetical protein